MGFSLSVERIFTVWFASLAAALCLVLASLGLANQTIFTPTSPVKAYFKALADGDGERALSLLNTSLPAENTSLISGQPLSASLADLENLTITTSHIDETGQKALVTASYRLNGQELSSDFYLSKSSKAWGIFDQWQLEPVELPTIDLAANTDSLILNDHTLALDQGERSVRVFFPGHYRASLDPALFTGQEKSLTLSSASTQNPAMTLTAKPSQQATEDIKKQIAAELDQCAAENTLYPADCPFHYSFEGRVEGKVNWKIKEYPNPSLSLDNRGQWKLRASKAVAEVSFTELDLYTGKTWQVKEEVRFTYSANVSLEQGRLILSNG